MPSFPKTVLALALPLVACGGGDPSPPDASIDASPDTSIDASRPDVSALDAPPSDTSPPDAPAPDAGPACDRATATRTAPRTLLDALRRDLGTLGDDTARRARVDRFVDEVRAQGGTPLDDGAGNVTFVVRGMPANGTWRVSLSTRGWRPDGVDMERVAGTDLYLRNEALSRDMYAEYKLVDGGTYHEDPLARNVVWDGIDHHAVGEFNAVVHPAAGDRARGRLEAWRSVPTRLDGAPRDVFVYLPASYDDGTCGTYPLFFVHDGNESLTRSPFQVMADRAFASGTPPVVLAFVALPSQDVRIAEYTFGTPDARADAYGRFLFEELDPMLSRTYRLRAGRDCRGLVGASLGGLVSLYLATVRPRDVAVVGAQSGSFWWQDDQLIHAVTASANQGLRVYLDSGNAGDSSDNLASVTAMEGALRGRGEDVTRVLENGAVHDWSAWQRRWPGMLSWLRRPGRCSTP